MKKIFFLFFLSSALLSGCNTNYNYPSKNITVRKTNGIEKEYGLLSVRGDSAIVVLDWAEAKVTPIPFSHAEVIKGDSISMISRGGQGGGGKNVGTGAAYGAAGGGVGGIIFLVYFLLPVERDLSGLSNSNASNSFLNILTVAAGIGAGALIGAFIGNAIPPSKELQLSSYSDREFLRSISLYPDKEPEIMQYIK